MRGRGPFARGWSTVAVLWRRDVLLFGRQRSRLIGALAQPLLFWLVLGAGLAPAFRMPGAEGGPGYLEYFFPGVVVMVVLFASIFSTMSVIEDRREGFLQGVPAAPGPRGAIAIGKVLGGATVAGLHAVLFLALCPLAGFPWPAVSWGLLLVSMILASVGLTAIGFVLAWWIDSTQGYHAIMSVVLIPLWVLSGALFPVEPTHAVLRWAGRLDPMSYAVSAVRGALSGASWGDAAVDVGVLAGLAVVALVGAGFAARQRGAGG